MVTLVEKAAQMLSASTVDKDALAHFDIESWTKNPLSNLQRIKEQNDIKQKQVSSRRTTSSSSSKGLGLYVPVSLPNIKLKVKNMTNELDDSPESDLIRKRTREITTLPQRKRRSDFAQTLNRNEYAPPSVYTSAQDPNLATSMLLNAALSAPGKDVRGGNGVSRKSSSSSGGKAPRTASRRCTFEGCTKCAQGKTSFCIAHGGGRRCTVDGCFKAARDKFYCAGHGGGKRCATEGCSKAAVGGSGFCTAHGGGKRCQHPGCNKSSQASTSYCVRHGGGRKCIEQNCNKAARSRTDYCASHGGNSTCRAGECMALVTGKKQYCRKHAHLEVEGEGDSNDNEEEGEEVEGWDWED